MWVMLHLYDAFSGFALKPIQLLFLFSSALEVRSVGVRVSRSLDFRNHHNVSPTEAEFIEQSREEKDY
jgi:hypothetical protein